MRKIAPWRSPVAVLVLLCGLLLFTQSGCGSQPQIGDNEEAFKEVEALYTAVTSKRADLLEASRKRLVELNSNEKISPASFKLISRIMDEAAEGKWSTAAPKLYDFMRAQRKSSSD